MSKVSLFRKKEIIKIDTNLTFVLCWRMFKCHVFHGCEINSCYNYRLVAWLVKISWNCKVFPAMPPFVFVDYGFL